MPNRVEVQAGRSPLEPVIDEGCFVRSAWRSPAAA
jgi:hypothetical protein